MEIVELYNLFTNSTGVCTDTRKIKENSLFFCLKGENFNGNTFAKKAIDEGASYSIIDEKEYQTEKTILVDNVLDTLQQLATHHRKQFDIPFIGITGTNGKTTSKELINAVLSQHFNTAYTQGNLNNHIGVPLTLLSINKNCEIAIIEMGANHIGEINELCQIAKPNYGIITNIGTAHIEGFGSKEGVIQTKSEMYNYISENGKLIFTNNDDSLLQQLSASLKKYTYGKANADCMASLLSETPNIKLNWNDTNINSTLYGGYNFYNILLAICIGQYFKVPTQKIIKGIETYISSNNRSQLIQLKNIEIYLDAYNANPSSMNVAIDSFSSNSSTNKLMILGDMLELGSVSKNEHQIIINKTHKLNIDAFFVGSQFNQAKEKHNFKYFQNTEDLISHLEKNNITYSSILIKGSRGIRLEKVAEYIQKKLH
ncbi:MAG: UDP-N-acetylmuramoyl-tripeptide--D-alanyl-D-alanine ligase [Flavobacteriales bacterium]|nr:UDP-N-acetylmuramoyl-tripeptide--D-alanyl-D-alanine ligase [Flavobacteriales bacterium]MCB9362967.1 UDP-N-acetylmuramoyl-tripeptide--D-alanyl-D-alanine ligase [Flavobacteriales bacterium]